MNVENAVVVLGRRSHSDQGKDLTNHLPSPLQSVAGPVPLRVLEERKYLEKMTVREEKKNLEEKKVLEEKTGLGEKKVLEEMMGLGEKKGLGEKMGLVEKKVLEETGPQIPKGGGPSTSKRFPDMIYGRMMIATRSAATEEKNEV